MSASEERAIFAMTTFALGDIEVMFHVEGGVHDLSYACHLMRPGDTRERAGVRV